MTMTEAPNFSTVLVPKSEKVVPGRTIVGIHLRDGGVRTLRLIKRVPNDFQNVDMWEAIKSSTKKEWVDIWAVPRRGAGSVA